MIGKGNLTLGLLVSLLTISDALAETNSKANDAQFENKVRDLLQNKPEIIVDALQKHTERQQQDEQAAIEASLTKYKTEISNESTAVVLGKKDAETKLVVFLDPNCPHCRSFTQALYKVRENFPNIAILVRHWPILGKNSTEVVRGLWAIKEQGIDQFNAAVKAIATNEELFTYEKLLAWVKDHKLDEKKFITDFKSAATEQIINDTDKLAKNIGLQGTPTSVLVNKKGIRIVTSMDEKSLGDALQKEAAKA